MKTENIAKAAYIIGNGLSRKGFNLKKLGKCVTVGCNSIHKDFIPTYLVAIDSGTPGSSVSEIRKLLSTKTTKKDARKIKFVTSKLLNKLRWMVVDGKPTIAEVCLNRGFCTNSGMYGALLLSQVLKYDVVYMIGMDFFRPTPDGENDIYGGQYSSNSGFIKVWNHMFAGAPTGRIEDGEKVVGNAIKSKFVRVGPIDGADRGFYENELKNLEYIESFDDMPIIGKSK